MKVEQAGIDTWKLAWRIREESAAARAMRSLASVKVKRGYAIEERLADHQIGWVPSANLIYAEGHPAGKGTLGAPAELAQVALEVGQVMHDYGIPVPLNVASWDRVGSPGFAGVGRLDITADLRFQSSAEGLAALAGIAALPLPRMASGTRRDPRGHLQTVAFYGYTGRQMLGRWYDKGVHPDAGPLAAPRGTLIRPEDQRRWGSGSRRGVEELSPEYVRDKFAQRWMPLWKATKGVTVGSSTVIAAKLGRLVEAKDLTPAAARSVFGYLCLEPHGVPQGSARTARHLRATARKHGLVLADAAMEEVEVNLHDVLDAALDGRAWGCDG